MSGGGVGVEYCDSGGVYWVEEVLKIYVQVGSDYCISGRVGVEKRELSAVGRVKDIVLEIGLEFYL